MKLPAVVRPGAGVSSVTFMVLFALTTVLLEPALSLPLKLPGHMALPGALTLLLAADVLAPAFLVGFSLIVPALLVALGHAEPWTILSWVLPATLLASLGRERWRTTLLYLLAAGVIFGLTRYLFLLPGIHRTPEILRLSGHLLFGGLGGLVAYSITRVTSRGR